MTPFIALIGVLMDQWLGEPRALHPLVGFGRLSNYFEKRINSGQSRKLKGVLGVVLLVLPIALLAWWASRQWGWFVDALLLYLALGSKSLAEHARRVVEPLMNGELAQARQAVARIVSRDTDGIDRLAVVRATIESVLENGADAIFGALFWFLLAGAPGVVAYRLINTLDAMWGYRTERFIEFGWGAAKLDDLLNWAPARLTALSYALMGSYSQALGCWNTQAYQFASPNGGPVMSAGAGALGIQLGGATNYHGKIQQKPLFGGEQLPVAGDIHRALDLVHKSLLLWLIVALLGGWLIA